MYSFQARLGAAALALLVAGCQSMPDIAPMEQQAAEASGVNEPFIFHVDGEPTDIEIETGPTLTLLSATRLALGHDPKIQAALAKVRQALADSQQQRLLPNPVIDLSIRLPESGGASIIDVGITAELLALIRRPGLISAADSRLRGSYSEALTTVLDVVSKTQQQYISVQALDARIKVAETRRTILKQLVDIARSRAEVGEASRLDTLTAQSEQATLETELIEFRADQRQARFALARSLGNPSAKADWPVDPWQAPQMVNGTVERWISIALQRRPEIHRQIWELEALGEEVKLAKLSPLDGSQVGATAERDDKWSVGPAVTAPLPIFDFGQAKRDAAQAKRIEARHALTDTRRQVVEEVRQAFERLTAAQSALDSVEKDLIPLQHQRREQAEDAYKLGLSAITTVQLAEQDLQATIAKRIELQERMSIALIELERAVGGSGVAALIAGTTMPSTLPAD